jgi:hypothetical protein
MSILINYMLFFMLDARLFDNLVKYTLLVVLEPNRIIHKRTDANCSNFHLRVFLGLSSPQGQRQTTTLSIHMITLVKEKLSLT